jgi:hypothetical protein
MDQEEHEVHWNSQLEKIISDEGERALCYSWLHDKSEERYTRFNNYITLPTIVGSTVAGTAAIGSKTLFGDSWYGNLGIGILSLGVAVFNTVATHFGWSSRADAHRVARIDYSKIHRFIMIELSLPREERTDASSMLKMVREQLDNLLATSPQIPNEIIVKFNNKFEGTTDKISKPGITNGLDPIEVFRPGMSPDQTPRVKSFARIATTKLLKRVSTKLLEHPTPPQENTSTPSIPSVSNSCFDPPQSPTRRSPVVAGSVSEGEEVVVNIPGITDKEKEV